VFTLRWPESGAARGVVAARGVPDIDLYTPASSPDDLCAYVLVHYVMRGLAYMSWGDITRLPILFRHDEPADLITLSDVSVMTAVDVVVRYWFLEVPVSHLDRSFGMAGVFIPEVAELGKGVCAPSRYLFQTRRGLFLLLLLHEEGKICRGESLFWPLQLVINSAQGLSNTGL